MPMRDKTGPMGMGSMTGRGMGTCGGSAAFGRRRGGRGLGWRRFWGYYPAPNVSKKEESEMLSEEEKAMEEELKRIKSRLVELKKGK